MDYVSRTTEQNYKSNLIKYNATENFVAISPVKIVFWFLNFATEICNIPLVLKKNVFVRITFLEPQSKITNLIS